MTEQPYSSSRKIIEKIAALEESIEKAKDTRFENYNTRLADMHKFLRAIIIAIGIFIIPMQIFFAISQDRNLNRQKSEILQIQEQQSEYIKEAQRALKEEIAIELGKSKNLPELELYTSKGEMISNQSVLEGIVEIRTATKEEAEKMRFPYLFDKHNRFKYLKIRFSIKNKGNAIAEKVWGFIYTKDPLLNIKAASYMEKDYTGEEEFDYMTGGLLLDGLLPPNIINTVNLTIRLSNDFDPGIHTELYPVMVKISYGKEEIITRRFFLRIASKPILIPFRSEEDVEGQDAHSAVR